MNPSIQPDQRTDPPDPHAAGASDHVARIRRIRIMIFSGCCFAWVALLVNLIEFRKLDWLNAPDWVYAAIVLGPLVIGGACMLIVKFLFRTTNYSRSRKPAPGRQFAGCHAHACVSMSLNRSCRSQSCPRERGHGTRECADHASVIPTGALKRILRFRIDFPVRSNVPLGISDLLKTMAKVGATDLALIPSAVPRFKTANTWRMLDAAPLKFTAIRHYAEQLMARVPESERRDGPRCEFVHEQHGRFRITACGYPDTVAVLLIRLTDGP